MRNSRLLAALAALSVSTLATAVRAIPVTISDFSGSEGVVTFTGLTGNQGTAFTNDTVTFTNTQSFNFQATSGFGFFNNIPGNSGDPVLFDSKGSGFSSDFTIGFSTPVKRAGLLFASSYSESYTLEAYDTPTHLLESVSTNTTGSQASFLGLEEAVDIDHLRLVENDSNDSVTLADDIRFENTPEPTSLAFLAVGFGGLLARRKRR